MSVPQSRFLIPLLAFSALATAGFLWGTEIPLGVPGEWTWDRIRFPDDAAFTFLLSIAMIVLIGGAYFSTALFGYLRIGNAPRRERAFWLAALTVAGFAWLGAIQESPAPLENQWGKAAWVTYYPSSSGYYYEARYAMPDVAAYLAAHEERMTKGDVLHFGTHPPGLAIFHRATIVACERFPALTWLLLSTQPGSVDEAFRSIEDNQRSGPRPLLPVDRAAIWLAVLCIQAVSVATVIPLYFLARRAWSPTSAWQACAFWPLVPSLAVFLPVSDAIYPFLGTLFLAVWLAGWSRGSILLCAISGVILWVGMFLSLAMLPVALLAVLVTLAEFTWKRPEGITIGGTSKSVGWSLLGFAVPIALLWFAWNTNLVAIWTWNLRNHEGFYDQNTRTYWKWLLVNPLELAFGLGWPLVILCASALVSAWKQPTRKFKLACFVFCFGVWAILWLSGKNMGEAARLWLLVMPWPVWLCAGLFDTFAFPDDPMKTEYREPPSTLVVWLAALAAQMFACFATVTRVNGFDFGL